MSDKENCYFTNIILERNKKLERENEELIGIMDDDYDRRIKLMQENKKLKEEIKVLENIVSSVKILDDEYIKNIELREENKKLKEEIINIRNKRGGKRN